MMALGVMKALKKGNRTGVKLRLLAYDDVYMAEIAGITTLRILIRSMVKEAFKTILGDEVRKMVFTRNSYDARARKQEVLESEKEFCWSFCSFRWLW